MAECEAFILPKSTVLFEAIRKENYCYVLIFVHSEVCLRSEKYVDGIILVHNVGERKLHLIPVDEASLCIVFFLLQELYYSSLEFSFQYINYIVVFFSILEKCDFIVST